MRMPDFDGESQPPEEVDAQEGQSEEFWSAAEFDFAAEEPSNNDFECDDDDDFVMEETAETAEMEVEADPAALTVEEAAAAVLEMPEIEVQDSQVMESEAMAVVTKEAEVPPRPVARPLTGDFQQVAVIDSDDEPALGSGSDSVPLQCTSEIVADDRLSREEKIEKLRGLLSQLQSLQDRAGTSAEEVAETVAEVRESLSL